MIGYGMDAGEAQAAALMTLRTAARLDHDWQTVFAALPQHPTAHVASLVDDAWLHTLNHRGDGAQ